MGKEKKTRVDDGLHCIGRSRPHGVPPANFGYFHFSRKSVWNQGTRGASLHGLLPLSACGAL